MFLIDRLYTSVGGKKQEKTKRLFFKSYFPVKLFSRHSTLRDSKLLCVLMQPRYFSVLFICFVLLLFLK